MILSRHADALLWVGRYLERAENTARCLNYAANAIIHLRVDEARIEGEQLVKALGLQEQMRQAGGLESRPQLVAFLLSDIDNPGSLVSSITAMRENLRSTRERVPIELWEEANGLYLRFPFLGHRGVRVSGLHQVLLMVRRACLAISGVLNEGMRRDEGYAFIVTGRMLERAIFTVGLLLATHTDPRGVMDATRVLRLTSSLQAYHRRHGHVASPEGSTPDPTGVVRYLLYAPDLPRSLLSSLTRAEECLKSLESDAVALRKPRRRAGLLRARLDLGEIEAHMASAPVETLSRLAVELAGLAEDVGAGVAPPRTRPVVHAQYVRPGGG